MKIRNFITLLGLVTLLTGCLAGGLLARTAESKLMHQSISMAGNVVNGYADTSVSPLSARLGNPVVEILYYFLRFFERPV
jgi:hypothetical protein